MLAIRKLCCSHIYDSACHCFVLVSSTAVHSIHAPFQLQEAFVPWRDKSVYNYEDNVYNLQVVTLYNIPILVRFEMNFANPVTHTHTHTYTHIHIIYMCCVQLYMYRLKDCCEYMDNMARNYIKKWGIDKYSTRKTECYILSRDNSSSAICSIQHKLRQCFNL